MKNSAITTDALVTSFNQFIVNNQKFYSTNLKSYDNAKTTILLDTIVKACLQKKINEQGLNAIEAQLAKISDSKEQWDILIKDRRHKLEKNSGLVDTAPTLEDVLCQHKLLPKLYYVKNRRLATKYATAVKLIDSISKSKNKLDIKLLASFFPNKQEPTKVTGWSKKYPRRNFIVLEFDSDKLNDVKDMIDAAYSCFNYILFKNDDKIVFILDLNGYIGKNGYKDFATEIAKSLGLKPTSKMTSFTHLVDIKNITKDSIISANVDGQSFDINSLAKADDFISLDPMNDADDKDKDTVPTTYYTIGRSHKILSAKMSATEVVKANNGKQIRLIGNYFEDEDGKIDAPKSSKDINSNCFIRKQFIAIRFNTNNQQNIEVALDNYCRKNSNGRYLIARVSTTQDVLVMDLAKAIDNSVNYENIVMHFANQFGIKATDTMKSEDKIIAFDYKESNILVEGGDKPFVITNDLQQRPNESGTKAFSYQTQSDIMNLDGYDRWFKIVGDKLVFLSIRKTRNFPKSMNEQYHCFDMCGQAYRIAHPKDSDKSYVIGILGKEELWCKPCADPTAKDATSRPASYFDWDKNIYITNPDIVNQMIMAVDPKITSSRVKSDYQQCIGDRRFANPMQYAIVRNHDLLALNNGVYDLNANKFMSYSKVSPISYCFTRKASVDYVEGLLDSTKEPTYEPNNWSISKWFTQIATDKNGKVNTKKRYALYQIILACLVGYFWGKTSAFLIDKNIGGTSKSTYLQLIKNILTKSGYESINLVQMCGKKSGDYLYRALGKSTIIGDEMDFSDPKTVITNSAPFKNITDNGEQQVHQFYKNPYSVSLNCFFIQAANVFPTFTDSSDSVFDRIYPVMFNHKFNAKKDQIIKNMIKTNIARKDVLEYLVAYILKNVRIDHGFVDTGENIDINVEQQEKQNTVVAFINDLFCDIRLQAMPKDTLSTLYHNYVEGGDFGRNNPPVSTAQLVEDLEQKTGWYAPRKRERSPFVKLRPKYGSIVKITDKVTGTSISLRANETLWSYLLGNMPIYDEREQFTNQADITGGLNDQLAENGLNKYFDQRRGFKTAEQLFDPPYVKYNASTDSDIDPSNAGYVTTYGINKASYLARFYKEVLAEAMDKPQRLHQSNTGKYLLANPSIDNWETKWLINGDVQKACQQQLNRYVEYLKVAIGLNSLTGNKTNIKTTHDIDFILLYLPKLVQSYYNMHSSNEDEANKALNFLLDNYGDVITPYVYTLPAVIKDKGAKQVKLNCQQFCQEHDTTKKQEKEDK